jgi:hypothetical protein
LRTGEANLHEKQQKNSKLLTPVCRAKIFFERKYFGFIFILCQRTCPENFKKIGDPERKKGSL